MITYAKLKSGNYFSTKESRSTSVERNQCDSMEICEVMRAVNVKVGKITVSYPFEDFESVQYEN